MKQFCKAQYCQFRLSNVHPKGAFMHRDILMGWIKEHFLETKSSLFFNSIKEWLKKIL